MVPIIFLFSALLASVETTTTLPKNTRSKPRPTKKIPIKNRPKNGTDRTGDLGTTQVMAGSTFQEGQKTDRPFPVPSMSPPWVVLNAANFRYPSVSTTVILLLLLLPATL